MAWERIALDEVARRVAEIAGVPTSAVAWVAAVVWLYAPYPRELQEAWTEGAAAVAKLERELLRRRDDWEAVEACRQLLMLYVPERGERIRARRERQPDGSELVYAISGADELLSLRPKPDRTRFLIALVEVLKERGGLTKQQAFAVVSELWPHVVGDRQSAESASRQYWRAVERYRETGVLAPVNLSQVDEIAKMIVEMRKADTSANKPTEAEGPGQEREPDEVPQEEWSEMPTGVPKWAVTMAETGRPPTAREMGLELEPSMEAYVNAQLRGEAPSEDMIHLPEIVAERAKAPESEASSESAKPAQREAGECREARRAADASNASEAADASGEPEPEHDEKKPPNGGAEGTDK